MAKPSVKYYITAEDKSKKTVQGVEANLKRAAKIGATALATASVAAGAALVALGVKAARAADNIGKLSTQLGISVQSLSEYKFIAEQTGVKFETFSMAIQRSTRRIAEAAQGTGEAQTALRELGIDAKKLSELDPGAQFEVLAKRLSEVTSESDQVRLAFKLFDSEGVRLLRTIKQTGGSFTDLREEARDLGGVLDKDLTQKAADVNDATAKIGTAMEGVGNSLLSTFSPAIVAAANGFVNFINNARKAAENLGLLDRRIGQLKLNDLNEVWAENNRLIVKNESIQNNSRSSAGRAAAKEKIVDLEKQNEEIKKQIELINKRASTAAAEQGAKAATVTGGLNIGGGGQSPEAAAEKAQAAEDAKAQVRADAFQGYLESLQTEEEALRASYANRIKIIEENTISGSDYSLELKQKEYARLETSLIKHQAKLGSIEAKGALARRNFENKTAKQKTAFVVNEMVKMTAGVAQSSKTMFKINKIAGIANAVINTARGVTMALASYPPPLSFAMAAAQAAAGFAQINAIKNTQFGGGGGIGTTPSSAGSAPSINSVPIETAPVAQELAPERNSVVNITFNPGITDTEAVRTFITEDLSEALRDGAGLDVRVVAQ